MSPSPRDTSLAPALAGATGLLLLIAAWLPPTSLPVPPCLFRTITHLPCPLCGGTHCFIALCHGELRRAFFLNPLVILSLGAIWSWFVIWGAEKGLQRPLRPWKRLLCRKVRWKIVGGTLLLAHWVYLGLTWPQP